MNNRISNNPLYTRRISYSSAWWSGAFTDDELDKLEKYCSTLVLQNGTTVGDLIDVYSENTNSIRKSNIAFSSPTEENNWIFNRFNGVLEELNSRYFNYNLYGYNAFQYTEYDYSYQGKYDWHMDLIMDDKLADDMWCGSTRKLSLVMSLNRPGIDYTGGEFQLNLRSEEYSETLAMERGKIYAFPSFIIHRVKPIITGIRKSIVIWVEGPTFM